MPILNLFDRPQFVPPNLRWPLHKNPVGMISKASTVTAVAQHCHQLPCNLKQLVKQRGTLPYELASTHVSSCECCQRNCLNTLAAKRCS